MSMLDEGLAWLNQQRETFLTSTVTYSRGADSVQLQATRGQSTFTRVDKSGFGVKVTQTDWLISAADLVLGGEVVQPLKGDQISDGVHTYQVEPNPADGAWKWSGPSYLAIRVHTKMIG